MNLPWLCQKVIEDRQKEIQGALDSVVIASLDDSLEEEKRAEKKETYAYIEIYTERQKKCTGFRGCINPMKSVSITSNLYRIYPIYMSSYTTGAQSSVLKTYNY